MFYSVVIFRSSSPEGSISSNPERTALKERKKNITHNKHISRYMIKILN